MDLETVFFEPWALGDAIIAAAVLRHRPAGAALACNSEWHSLLRDALLRTGCASAGLIAVDLNYTRRGRRGRLALSSHRLQPISPVPKSVLSIRGDMRDYWCAKRIFPGARVHMSGWLAFTARRSRLADVPFRLGWREVRNRYQAWAALAGVTMGEVVHAYQQLRTQKELRSVIIHVGAQWRSKQYPDVANLRQLLASAGLDVQLLAGPSDGLPSEITEREVERVSGVELSRALQRADCIVANDSSPMHLAAFLGCRTVAIARISNIDEWLPPGVHAVVGRTMPRGYRPARRYASDALIEEWPSAQEVAEAVLHWQDED